MKLFTAVLFAALLTAGAAKAGYARQPDAQVDLWRKAIEQGDKDAQFELGLASLKGGDKDKDAVIWLHQIIDEKDFVGFYCHGMNAGQGDRIDDSHFKVASANPDFSFSKKFREAFTNWVHKESGWEIGVTTLGNLQAVHCDIMTQSFLGNSFKSVKSLRGAAEQGNADAQGNLAFVYESLGRLTKIYFNGNVFLASGAQNDIKKAVEWYRKAAEQGDAGAQFRLGMAYLHGDGVEKDEKEALHWLRKAAQNDPQLQYSLGEVYYNGDGITKDDKEAVKWYRKAAEQGDKGAQYILGKAYHKGEGIGKDDKEAVRWYRKAADQGNPVAQYFLGEAYHKGEGVGKDDKEAVKWYRKSAEERYFDTQRLAESRLGQAYFYGQGVGIDTKEALNWWRKAADQGDPYAQGMLKVNER